MQKIKAKVQLTLNFVRKYAKPLAACATIILIIGMTSSLAVISLGIKGNAMPAELHIDGKYIKDSQGNIIYLRGLQKVEMADDPDGSWMGNPYWSDANVKAELEAMKSWAQTPSVASSQLTTGNTILVLARVIQAFQTETLLNDWQL